MVIVILALFIQQLISGLAFNNNVLELLPKTTANKVNAAAEQRFTSAIGNQVVFLVGNPDKAQAEQAAQIFYRQITQSAVFEKINFLVSNNEQAWPAFYFPYRLGLLPVSQQRLLQTNQEQVVVTNAMANLYSPFGAANTNTLATDPYFLFQQYLLSLPKPSSTLTVSDQQLMVQYQGQWYVMVTAQMQGNSFSVTSQQRVSTAIESAKQAVQQQVPATQLLMSGTIFYAQAGSAAAEHDITVIGFGSLIGIILLVWLTFRSVKPLIYTVLSSAVGFIAALVVTHWVFGSIYLFTLIFGASLLGIAVDYAYFYYAEQLTGNASWTAALGLKRIFSGITLGLWNVVLAYFIIAFTPFPGLKQLAVFSITGLVAAYLTVVCIFPLLIKPRAKSSIPFMLKFAEYYLSLWRKLSIKKVVLIYLVIAVVLATGLSRIMINDDVRVLQRMPAALQAND
ncbi:MAG: MMPL family transporter, partial [Gammaproteobacteria bacterium]|nr:MMPL family transporter [Gammaproteobacteria bacterium]